MYLQALLQKYLHHINNDYPNIQNAGYSYLRAKSKLI